MLDYDDYKTHIRKMIDNYDTISKEDLYDAFLDMTERYLTEMVSTLNYEKFIIKEHGEDEGNQIIEQVVTSNLALRDLDETNAADIEPRERIENLLSYIDCEFSSGLN